MSAKKRFIAGVVCPRCGQLDKIMMYREHDVDYRECVACDFKDEMRFKPQLRELGTRVNTSAEQVAQETQVVRIFGGENGPDSEQ